MRTPLICLCLSLCAATAHAQSAHPIAAPAVANEQHSVRQAVSSGRYRPLADILRIVEQHVPGRVVEIEMEADSHYGPIYEVEVLDAQHRKREISIHAETGQLVEMDDQPVRQQLIALPQLLRQVHAHHPGHVEDAELETTPDGRSLYTIKLIQPNGQPLEVQADARSGEWLEAAPLSASLQPMRELHELLDAVLQRYPGTVQEAELERQRSDNTWYYEIDIRQTDSTVTVHVDPHNGHILRERRKKHK